MLDINQIKNRIPHRYPFLLVDKILEVVEGKKAVGFKNVTYNEPLFIGQFPSYPVMPGILIVEALAQVGGIVMSDGESTTNKIGLLTGIDKCRFKKQVNPGDQLHLEFEVTRVKGQIVKGNGKATVDNELVCEVEIMFALVEALN
ncbi:3-hydroxyacyl-ACP dehydratase FabZ [Paenibacillus sp. JDR-2]|uniref:3-hydroxyacyl-ACP dehydratase FabZ n=1 Tax=Paenibacillus sp. (strain JDR-2) TaxID=324057 RepID=UPI0001665C6E|nr:3-hydroxyacyl-ACP dehydratase FabZ [Paenibacillus sp. JDR-2]ACT03195.1 beta-hydroxyacyl-(acyl-carrier-protein) dehydratase FabZ [Paenibacillus sp. JDR-2]